MTSLEIYFTCVCSRTEKTPFLHHAIKLANLHIAIQIL